MTITFIGHGYVGLVTASIFADLGNTVWVVGHTPEKIENLKKGIIPIFEPGLEEIVKRNVRAGRLLFTMDYDKAIPESSAIFIAVGTPPKSTGEADLTVVYAVAEKLANHLSGYTVVSVKSTVPVGTNKKVKKLIEDLKPEKAEFDIASIPEFLREGQAISDTMHPDRIVIGTESKKAQDLMVELHEPIDGNYVLTNIETAEMIKYAANAFLATKISFANAIAYLSELTGADGLKVLEAVGFDKRVGSAFLSPGAGYGGSCFPKDVKALIAIAGQNGYDFELLKSVEKINTIAMNDIFKKAEKSLGGVKDKSIAVLGLSFKPDTDDMRDAPSVVIINKLLEKGAKIKVFDPVAMNNAKKIIKGIEYCKDSYETAKESEILIVLTEWNEFRQIDLKKVGKLMKKKIIIDARNIYDPEKVKEFGFIYIGVGR
ncbi:MAG: UDP-glucose 6-dehydrogenase [Candidatus Levybacteria bacterium CG_4_9_14_3_um_filter_35_16]|nr:MAG: UDP-glucose 6-dehydrogenase [Candidatus Levybacteria bacterium CG22_combo_CG10-13_8_21_14_all_35_11]PIY94161.1 MAG: UDP-glucose 6-dehydrogenase [Candidatus Levybacteria bacterium CG_4_10_14_0_8_um_filter_35_23]PJA91392.1 MAG: UDP-glucose 6-dehydrogenase [Candidatus Levybacteria bacterium CG_4_9_14_3_um_filter_35_16]PJC54183.1 MAG: UDP-glucose 6-dehydrogenase [Candidatus Levybacteria bacterium CG_4_9_14_0_2_um_filter_35_21]